jgi:hypothetical protein
MLPVIAIALTLAAPAPDQPTIKVGGMVQPELTFFPADDDEAYTAGFQFRRMRPMLTASWGIATLRLVPELAGSRVRGQDVFLDLTLQKDACGSLVLRVGKDKPPISMDLLQSSTTLAFLERSPTAQLSPDRDIGVALHFKRGIFESSLMVANGTADVSNVDAPTGDFEVSARLGVSAGPVFFGVSGSYGEADEGATLPSYRSNGRRALFESGEVVDPSSDVRWRLGGHLRVELGPALIFAEAIHSEHRVALGAWQAGVSVLAGTSDKNKWNQLDKGGDLELAARVGQLATDLFAGRDDDERLGYTSASLAVSYNLDGRLKVIAGYEIALWDALLDDRAHEQVVGLRLQGLLLETP